MVLEIGLIVVAYLIGSVPFGYLIARSRGIDIREHGSGNIGATNVSRVLGKGPGRVCFVLDVLKGAIPTLVAGLVISGAAGGDGALALTRLQMWVQLGVAFATVVGHMFPIWLRLRGGKGVATGFGAMLGIWPIGTLGALGALLIWIVTLRLWRYVGVSSCLAAVSLPILVGTSAVVWDRAVMDGETRGIGEVLMHVHPYLIATSALAVLVVVRHRGNLARTLAGTEPKVGTPVDEAEAGDGAG